MTKTILIVDDEKDIRALIAGILEDEGYNAIHAASSDEAYRLLETHNVDLMILDIWLEGSAQDGMQILSQVRQDNVLLPVIMISGHGSIETAVEALKEGAYDFIEKPFKTDRLLVMVKRALETASLQKENRKLRSQNAPAHLKLIGASRVYKDFETLLSRVAKTNSRVLLTGESGTGKTAAALFLHQHSARKDGPFVSLNCATLNPDRFEVELFGAEKGVAGPYDLEGLLQESHGGTLLLDEVSDMPPATQAKIMMVLQENRFQRVGGKDYHEVDVRFIATTHKDLKVEIEEGRFREDLFYRLNVVPINVPSLRECKDDLALFIERFAEQIAVQNGMAPCHFSDDALKIMKSYHWPGNMRQLRNVIEWVMIMKGSGEPVEKQDLPSDLLQAEPVKGDSAQVGNAQSVQTYATQIASILDVPLKEARNVFERDYLGAQLDRFDGNISKTADFIGMERSALHRKIKQLQLHSPNSNVSDNKNLKINKG